MNDPKLSICVKGWPVEFMDIVIMDIENTNPWKKKSVETDYKSPLRKWRTIYSYNKNDLQPQREFIYKEEGYDQLGTLQVKVSGDRVFVTVRQHYRHPYKGKIALCQYLLKFMRLLLRCYEEQIEGFSIDCI